MTPEQVELYRKAMYTGEVSDDMNLLFFSVLPIRICSSVL